jgi:hypothetical protein
VSEVKALRPHRLRIKVKRVFEKPKPRPKNIEEIDTTHEKTPIGSTKSRTNR